MDWQSSRIINSNGQRYRVGWDEHGWFSLTRVEPHPEKDEWVKPEDAEMVTLSPAAAEGLIEAYDEQA